MSYDLVISSGPSEINMALLKDGVLTELHKQKSGDAFSVGDIYLGRVKKVVPSLNAAFVEVGHDRDAFLHYLDLGQQYQSQAKFSQEAIKGNKSLMLHEKNMLPDIDKEGKIKDVLSGGHQILVQIAKEPISNKGPRLSAEITLAGRYLVLVPFSNKISLSQKIRKPEERDRLRSMMMGLRKSNFGVIIRTVAENKKASELEADFNDLMKRWKEMVENLNKAKPPRRILSELDKTSALLRDILSSKFNNIHVDSEELAEELKEFLRTIAPDQEKIVKVYKGKLTLFDQFGINKQIKASFGKQVMLKSGVYLIVEHTEAMHVIDVNSGNRKGSKTQEENALETNMEAAEEIARICRLRDMGGIICVDFIDMGEQANQKKLYEHLKACMAGDKAKHSIIPPSKFGVVEITRQRVKPETDIKTTEKCPVCNGAGEVEATVLLVDEIEASLNNICAEMSPSKVSLRVHPFLDAYLKNGLRSFQRKWFMKHKLWVSVIPDSTYSFLKYSFHNRSGEEFDI